MVVERVERVVLVGLGVGLFGRIVSDGDRYGDIAPELLRKRRGDEGAEPAFQVFLRELIGGREKGGVFYETQGPGYRQPGSLMRAHGLVESRDDAIPYFSQIVRLVRHSVLDPFRWLRRKELRAAPA